MQRWKLTIEYDGTPYCGWQRQSHALSIQQRLEDAFFAFCQQTLTLSVAGRTDAGVHARGQVAHVDLDYGERPLSGYDLVRAVNFYLRESGIVLLEAVPVPMDFHARYSALSKLYTYRVLNRLSPPALERHQVWHLRDSLDCEAMREGAACLIGHHDFTTFRAINCQAKSPLRTLDRLDIQELSVPGGREILFHAEGRSFLHHQVRNMVGTLSLVGRGKWAPEDVAAALAARDRTRGGPTAPPDGLALISVRYDSTKPSPSRYVPSVERIS